MTGTSQRSNGDGKPVLEVEDLTIQYETDNGQLTAVSGATFDIHTGEYFGLVGESGCGKSTIAKSLLGGLDANGEISSGTIRYKGDPIQDLSEEALNDTIRWKEISWIPQSSMNSLDPLQRVSEMALELAEVHTDLSPSEARSKFVDMFETVGLSEERIDDYPHQFSGGMQQRAIIALALFLEPSLIVADEPTTALDVIMQDQVFTYLDAIKDQLNTSLLLITHDISVVFESCDAMAIMHGGQIAEYGPILDLFDTPHHPYSLLLQDAFPDHRHPNRELAVIEDQPPQVMGEVDFCTFVDRCPWAIEECRTGAPPLDPVDSQGAHYVACIRSDEVRDLYEAQSENVAQHSGVPTDD